MVWFRKLRIWWYNFKAKSLINEYAYWLMTTSSRKLGLDPGSVSEGKAFCVKAREKMDALHAARNAYAYKHNLKPHPNAPDNWRENYEKESATGNGSLNE